MQEIADQDTAIQNMFDGFPALFEDSNGTPGQGSLTGITPDASIGSTFEAATQDSGDPTDQIIFGVDELSVAGPSGVNRDTPRAELDQKVAEGDEDYVIE